MKKRKENPKFAFLQFTNLYSITGTSYRLVLGRVYDTWTMRLIKDDGILKQQMFPNPESTRDKPLSEQNYFPEAQTLIEWVKMSILPPNVNEHSISQTVELLMEEAKPNFQRHLERIKREGKDERVNLDDIFL